MYAITETPFRTPRGAQVNMAIRADTNDWNTLNACMTEDEYRLRELPLSGWALDVGAYIGGVTVALLVDNPELKVLAIEPVPDNVELLIRNLGLNGVLDRARVIDGAAGDGTRVNVRYGYEGSELATHHAFVGNASFMEEPGPDNPHKVLYLASRQVQGLEAFTFAKIDCEGCEWETDLSTIPHVRGEWHPVRGHTRDEIAERLPKHTVTFTGPELGPGGFEAVLR
jgi:FkbM family methyltransferase